MSAPTWLPSGATPLTQQQADERRAALADTARARAEAFRQRFPKVDGSPQSIGALVDVFRRAGSGGRTFTGVPGEYLPSQTRSAASELRTLMAYARRPDVERIELVPSRRGGRTPDMIAHQRGPNGVVTPTRVEVTSLVDAPFGYQPVGGRPRSLAEQIAKRVDAKALPAQGDSQLVTPMQGVPAGGNLVVHLPQAGPDVDTAVNAAMRVLTPRLVNAPHVAGVDFVLPGQRTVRFVRTPLGLYVRLA
jgi:hypothetical protein